MKRLALAGSRHELLAAARLFSAAPDSASTALLLKGFEEAYQGRTLAGIPDQLASAIAETGGGSAALRLRQGDSSAIQEAMAAVVDSTVGTAQRLQYLQIFGELRRLEGRKR